MIKKKPKISSHILYSDALDERKLYNTREEIMDAELKESETGRINWKNFDRLVAEGRQKIEEEIAASRAERQRKAEEKQRKAEEKQRLLVELERQKEEQRKQEEQQRFENSDSTIFVYNLTTDEFIGEYATVTKAASALNMTHKMIESALYNRNGKYKKGNMRFVKKSKPRLAPVPVKRKKGKVPYGVCVFNLETDEFMGEYMSMSIAASALDISEHSIQSAIYNRDGKYLKGNLRFVRKYFQV